MVVYIRLEVSGAEVIDDYNLNVNRETGESNSSSSFNAQIENFEGRNSDKFTIGNTVSIFADKNNLIYSAGSPFAQWKLNEGTGTIGSDTLGNFHGVLSGAGAGWTSGLFGSAFRCSQIGVGSGGIPVAIGSVFSVGPPSGTELSIGSDFSICAWTFPINSETIENHSIFAKLTDDIDGRELYFLLSNGSYRIVLYRFPWINGSQTGFFIAKAPGSTWSHAAVTKTGSQLIGYYNGDRVGSAFTSGTFQAPLGSTVIGAVKAPLNLTNNFYGYLNDVRFYYKALTPNEISEIYNLGSGTLKVTHANEKIFEGIVEDIQFKGQPNNEKIELTGRDYASKLFDRTVEPNTFTNLQAGSIIRYIVNNHTDQITTSGVSNGSTVERIKFNHTPVYDAIKQLADSQGYAFWVNESKDLYFGAKNGSSSGYLLDNTNVIKADFKDQRDTLYNDIWVYGDRYLDFFKETTTYSGLADQGSQVTLGYKPHNTSVTISGGLLQPGGVNDMSNLGSNVKYLVDYDDKQIWFTSGTNQGNNIPTSGNSVVVDYYRALPVVVNGQNDASINSYGRRTKVIVDKNIKDPAQAEMIMLNELDKSSDPLKEGNLEIDGIVNIIPGQTVNINLPYHNIDNTTYEVISADYEFSPENNLTDSVLKIQVNKKLPDITDAIKNLYLKLKKAEAGDIDESEGLTRYQQATGSLIIRTSGLEFWTRGIGSSFILGHPINGLLGSYTSHTLGDWRTGSTLQFSGGYP